MKAKYLIAMGLISVAIAGANATTSNAEEAESTAVVQDAGSGVESTSNSNSDGSNTSSVTLSGSTGTDSSDNTGSTTTENEKNNSTNAGPQEAGENADQAASITGSSETDNADIDKVGDNIVEERVTDIISTDNADVETDTTKQEDTEQDDSLNNAVVDSMALSDYGTSSGNIVLHDKNGNALAENAVEKTQYIFLRDKDNVQSAKPVLVFQNGKFYQIADDGKNAYEVNTVQASNIPKGEDYGYDEYYVEYNGAWYPYLMDSDSFAESEKCLNASFTDNKYLFYDNDTFGIFGYGDTSYRVFEGWNQNEVIWAQDILKLQYSSNSSAIEGVFLFDGNYYFTTVGYSEGSGAALVEKKTDDNDIVSLTFTNGEEYITGWQNNDAVKMADSEYVTANLWGGSEPVKFEINPKSWKWDEPLGYVNGYSQVMVFSYDGKWWESLDGVYAFVFDKGETYDPNKLLIPSGPDGWQGIVLGGPDYSKRRGASSSGNSESTGNNGNAGTSSKADRSNSTVDSGDTDKEKNTGRISSPDVVNVNSPTSSSAGSGSSSVEWVYNDRAGNRVTGWQYIDRDWYYFNDDGILQHNWLTYGGHRYYLDPDTGIRQSGWKTIDEEKYYFDEDGIMQTGWVEIDEKWYYFDEDGVMQTKWLTLDDKTYYLGTDGVRVSGRQTIDGKKYTFDKDGVLKE